jgi:hypothetical protein
MNYNIPGFKIADINLSKMPEFGYITYKSLFCKFSISKDSIGTQICFNGTFFGPYDFKNIDEAVQWMQEDNYRCESAKRIFRKVWLKSWGYTFSDAHIIHLVWKVLHGIFPNFYLNGYKKEMLRISVLLSLGTILCCLIFWR